MNIIAKTGICIGFFLAGRWTHDYNLRVQHADEEKLPSISTPNEPSMDVPEEVDDPPELKKAIHKIIDEDDPNIVEIDGKKMIKMVPGYVYDEENHIMVKIPEELTDS